MSITQTRTNRRSSPVPSANISSPIAPRTRVRAINVEATATPVQPVANGSASEATMGHLRDFILANVRANRFKREADAAKKALNAAMQEDGIKTIQSAVIVDGVTKTYAGTIAEGESDVISVEKLRALVDNATFMKIVSATKTAVVEHCGSNVATACIVTQKTAEALSLKEGR
jgi:hypothetical protein